MATPTELQQLYLAYFGRPAEPGGLAFYANTPVSTVLLGFSASPESRALYGASFTTASVKAIYTYLFNRSAADSEAAFWVGVVNAPNSAVSPAAAALTILQSAHNDDFTGITNKLAVATAFTSALDTTAEVAGYSGATAAALARSFLATVGAAATSVTSAWGRIDAQIVSLVGAAPKVVLPTVQTQPVIPGAPAPAPQVPVYQLTPRTDSVTGTAGDDSISGLVAQSGGTYTSDDVIDGGGGVDTLSLGTYLSFTLAGGNLSNVEKLALSAGNSGNQPVTVTLQGVTGLTDILNVGSDGTSSLTVEGVPNVVNVSVLSTFGDTTVKVDTAALAGAADAFTLTLGSVGFSSYMRSAVALSASTPNANEYEALTINSTGTPFTSPNLITLHTDATQTSLRSLTITGAGPLDMHLAANDNIGTSLTTINASASSGGVILGSDAGGVVYGGDSGGTTLGAANQTVTLGSGNDTVYFGPNLNGSDTVDGGAGTDTLGVSAALTAASLANVRNFEVVRFDTSSNGIVQDAGLAGLAGFGYVASGANALTLNNLGNNATTTVVSNLGALFESLQNGGGGADSLTLALASNSFNQRLAIGTLANVAGLETLHLVSATPTPTSLESTISIDLVTAAHVVTGNVSLVIGGVLATTSVDASAFSGKLTIRTSDSPTTVKLGGSGSLVVLGTGADTVSSGAISATVQLGVAGGNHSSGADTITINDSFSTVRFTGNNAAGTGGATDYSGFASITNTYSFSPFTTFGISADDTDFVLKTNGGTHANSGLAKGAVAQGLATFGAIVTQAVAKDAGTAAAAANVTLFRLSTSTPFTGDVKGTFAAAMGNASVTGLAANGNYLVSLYDTSHSKAVIAVVNTGGSAEGDTVLSASDFTNADVAVLGVVNTTAANYAGFGGAFIPF